MSPRRRCNLTRLINLRIVRSEVHFCQIFEIERPMSHMCFFAGVRVLHVYSLACVKQLGVRLTNARALGGLAVVWVFRS